MQEEPFSERGRLAHGSRCRDIAPEPTGPCLEFVSARKKKAKLYGSGAFRSIGASMSQSPKAHSAEEPHFR